MILDCDLLVGRDITSARTLTAGALADQMAGVGISGGAAASLRSLPFNARSGNDEAGRAAAAHGWFPVAGIDLRDPLGAEWEIEHAAEAGVRLLRLAPQRQGIAGAAPRLRLLARAATRRGLTLLVEGAISDVAPGLTGLGASVVLLDLHFYDLGEFVLLAREEAGLHASTRLLGGPDAWRTVVGELGPERLVLGTRVGWYDAEPVLCRLATAGLDEHARGLITEGNLLRLGWGGE